MSLNLKPGELVRIKPHVEILATIDASDMNGRLFFDVEMVPFCGGVYRVRARVEQFIDERAGRTKSSNTSAVFLADVWCHSRFSTSRMFCPRVLLFMVA